MANIRATASLTAAPTDSLVCGSQVIIEELTDTKYSLNGITAPWLKIKYRKDNAVSAGYLWLGLLALGHYKSGGVLFLYGIDKITAGTATEDYNLLSCLCSKSVSRGVYRTGMVSKPFRKRSPEAIVTFGYSLHVFISY